ncbi:ElyC/SanA/YdcF family protein [Candidatus Omnitrophota bacterium]
MLKNENIIFISSIDWDFNWQGHQEIAWAMAQQGNKVLFIENTGIRSPNFKDLPRLWQRFLNWRKGVMGIRKKSEHLYIFSPIVLPFPYSRLARWLNRHLFISVLRSWIKAMDFFDPVIWTFLPTGTALEVIKNIDSKLVVYYCIADFEELVSQPKKLIRAETELLQACDLVFAQGEQIAARCRKFNPRVTIFPFGVRLALFQEYRQRQNKDLPEDVRQIKRPLLGYVGAVHKHFDFELTEYLIENNPDCSFVFVGPLVENVERLKRFRNAFFLGEKTHSSLPGYINSFDVCLIPYNLTKYTKTVYPTKLNEYLIMGKPVVSIALPEVKQFNSKDADLVLMAEDKEEFNACIRKALSQNNPVLTQKRIEVAQGNSWERRVAQMSSLMEEAIQQNQINREEKWQDILVSFFHHARVRALRLLATAAILYAAVFYTPVFWWMAEPLKIAQQLKPAGAIVVLAGGVGESGKAAQGYEERVQYAVRLYEQGYAERLIFSSGYMYVFKESLVMQALAVSLGVPETKIILENQSANTYQNVKFVKAILDKKGWDKIILISSPYHMRRTALAFKKQAPDTEVIYAPIPHSQFYSRNFKTTAKLFRKQINLAQIKAILHEYLGIVYYWWKGYI